MIKEKKREINDEVTETNDSFFSSTQIEVPKKINIDCFSPILSTPTGNDVKKVKKESKTKEKGGGEGGIKNKMEYEKMKLIEKFLECGEKNSKEESKGGDEKGAEEYKKKEKRIKKKMKGKESKEDEEKSLLHSKLLQDALDSLNSSRDDPVGGSANETNTQKSKINDNDNDMKCSNEFLIGDDAIDNVNNNNSSKANDDKCKNKIKKDKDKKKKKKEKKEKKNRSKSKRKNTSKEFLCTELLKNALNYLNSISEDADDVVKEEEEKGDEKMGKKENDNRESEGFINSSDNSSDVFVKEKITNKKRRKKEKKKC